MKTKTSLILKRYMFSNYDHIHVIGIEWSKTKMRFSCTEVRDNSNNFVKTCTICRTSNNISAVIVTSY